MRPDDDQLSAWLDGELPASQRESVGQWLREHPEDAAHLQLWAADRDALRARFNPLLDEPVSDELRQAVMTGPAVHESAAAKAQAQAQAQTQAEAQALAQANAQAQAQTSATEPAAPAKVLPLPTRSTPLRQAPRWALAAMAAGLLIAGGVVGAALTWQLKPGQDLAMATRSTWTHRAAVAHVVYVPEVRHPVEVAVSGAPAAEQLAQEQHLARWLTKRLDMPVRTFDLRSHGFELVGGRLLPDAVGPSAQLMYQNSAGQRVTVYLRRPEPGTANAFRFHREGEVGMFYWVEDGFGCALVGTLPRETLLALAESAYQQSEAAARGPAVVTPKPAS